MPTLTLPPPVRTMPAAPPNSQFARRFRELIAAEPAQWAVGQKIGCTQSYVGQIARGQSHPSRELVERIIDAYALPREEWLNLAGYGKQAPEDPLQQIQESIARMLERQDELAAEIRRNQGRSLPVLEPFAGSGDPEVLQALIRQATLAHDLAHLQAKTGAEAWDAGTTAFREHTGRLVLVEFSSGRELSMSEAYRQLAELWREYEEDPESFPDAPGPEAATARERERKRRAEDAAQKAREAE